MACVQVSALGFVSVFDQVLEGLPQDVQDEIFKAYMSALDENGDQYRSDATTWEAWGKELTGTCAHRRARPYASLPGLQFRPADSCSYQRHLGSKSQAPLKLWLEMLAAH